ncbi:Insulin-like growth factor-binding protein complex acid labile subunit [Nymphon striatum]|nr:Insulin-like growth factor-binding protein complex acid labile subunit [Nymphon striatum]
MLFFFLFHLQDALCSQKTLRRLLLSISIFNMGLIVSTTVTDGSEIIENQFHKDPKLIISVILFINAVFNICYISYGALKQKQYYVNNYVLGMILVLSYCVIETVFNTKPLKLITYVRLTSCLLCLVPNLYLCYKAYRFYYWKNFSIIGISEDLEVMYNQLCYFKSLFIVDFQISVMLEIKWLAWCFAFLSLLQPAYVIYTVVIIFRRIVLIHLLFVLRVKCNFDDEYDSDDEAHICQQISVDITCHCADWEVRCHVDGTLHQDDWDSFEYDNDTKILEVIFNDNQEDQTNTLPYAIFSHLKALQDVEMTKGTFPTIKTFAFKNLTSLHSIHLKNNKIKRLEKFSFSKLESLQLLSLSENEIKKINNGVFVDLPNLEKLDLDINLISFVEDNAFSDLQSLQALDLNKNEIVKIGRYTLSGLENLHELILSHNKIENIDSGSFLDLGNLKVLNLEENLIQTVHPQAFEGLSNMKQLFLGYNDISSLSTELFQYSSQLLTIDLHGNRLATMKQSWFQSLNFSNLIDLAFKDNSLECSCELEWLVNMTEVNHLIHSEVKNTDCEVIEQYPYPDKVIGDKYYLEDFYTLNTTHLCSIETLRTVKSKSERSNKSSQATSSFMLLFVIFFITRSLSLSI